MMNRLFVAAVVVFAVGGTAAAQSHPSQKRLDEIWDAVDARVSAQIDVWFDHDGDFPKVIQMLIFETTYYPHDYDVCTNLGWMQENVEEWDAAVATYKLYLKNNPTDKDRALPLADYMFRMGRMDDLKHKPADAAKEYAPIPALLEPLIPLRPHPNNYRILAHTYEKQHRLPDAIRVWKAYVAAYPDDAAGKVNLSHDESRLKAAGSGAKP